MPAPITIYTDGSCRGNPGPGGYGVLLVSGPHRKELTGGFRRTTNNRMELMAFIVGLESIKQPATVDLYSDSKYVIDSIKQGWAKRWKANGWKRNKKDKAVNPDLWERLLTAVERHDVTLHWVKGHAGHPENERCDELATTAAVEQCHEIDIAFEEGEATR